MVDEGKTRVERFNGVNFGFWKIQIKEYMYQKDPYLPLGRKTHNQKEMSDGEWEILDQKTLRAI